MTPEGSRRSHSTSKTYGGADCASFAICSRDGGSGRTSREHDPILLAVDGEPHTEAAVGWALDLAIGLGLKLYPVHVRDPYLKQFHNDIYAQGREEYLEHVEDCLDEKARTTVAAFEAAVRKRLSRTDEPPELSWTFDVLSGNPAERLSALIDRSGFSMVVLGRRRRTRVRVLRSRDLAERLQRLGCKAPMLVVPELEVRPETPRVAKIASR